MPATMPASYGELPESERLTVRRVTDADAKAWAAFFDDAESLAYLPKIEGADNQSKARYWIDRQQQRYANKQYGLLAFVNKQSNALVGQCGLLLQQVNNLPELEVGYHILPQYRRQGYAAEAAHLVFTYAFEHNLSDSIISIIDVANVASQAVAHKNGLQRGQQLHWNGLNVYIYRIAKPW